MKTYYTVARVAKGEWEWTNKIYENREAAQKYADVIARALVVPFKAGDFPDLPDLDQAAPWLEEIAT